jgi:hypothetical protein
MKLIALVFAIVLTLTSFASLAADAARAKSGTFEAPASALTPKGTVQGRMVGGGTSATCTSSDGKSTCTCAGACWAGESSCGCPGDEVVQSGIKSGTIKFREQRTK